MLEFNHAHINTIIDAKIRNQLVVFLGAGFSKICETDVLKLPNWGELVGELKKELETSESDFLKIAQLYFLQFGEYRYYQKIQSLFPDGLEPSDVHKKIFDIDPSCIITTNWDSLLEMVVEDNGFMYEIVASDANLVSSKLPKKIIKMHGDFLRHNIVFKEDDYLKYSFNFPLIENYIKSLLSTHVVVFIGYSYGDVDLKIISKWIENHSRSSPPKFMLRRSSTLSDDVYLKSHGIITLCPLNEDNNDPSYKDIFDGFLDVVSDSLGDNLIRIIAKKYLSEEGTVGDDDKDQVVKYMESRVRSLHQFSCLLPEQIRNKFSNVTLDYHKNCFGLTFHSIYLTTDFDKEIRAVYSVFFESILDSKFIKKHKDLLLSFFSVFLKANCMIVTNKEYISVKDFIFDNNLNGENVFRMVIDNNNKFEKYIEFSEINDYFYGFRNNNKNEDLLYQIKNLVAYFLKTRSYGNSFFQMFNYNLLLDVIRNSISIKKEKKDEIFSVHKKYDLSGRIRAVPFSFYEDIELIEQFLNFHMIYKWYYDSHVNFKKNYEVTQSNKNGKIAFDSEETQSELRCEHFLKFIFVNKILFDEYSEVKNLFIAFIENKIKLQSINGDFSFNEIDLFILIRYSKTNDLRRIINNALLDKQNDEKIEINFSNLKRGFLNTFKNIFNTYLNFSNFNFIYIDKFATWLNNGVLVASLVVWSDDDLEEIVSYFVKVVHSDRATYDFYKSINYFIAVNFKVSKKSYPSLKKIIDAIVLKNIYGNFGFDDDRLLDHDLLSNAFRYFSTNNIIYDNLELIEKLIILNANRSNEEKEFLAKNFLLKLYPVSSADVKEKVKDFVDVVFNAQELGFQKVIFWLEIINYTYIIKNDFLLNVKDYILNLSENDLIQPDFLRLGGIEQIYEYVFFFVNERKMLDLTGVLEVTKDKIDKFKGLDNLEDKGGH